jgi:hypothetical protein
MVLLSLAHILVPLYQSLKRSVSDPEPNLHWIRIRFASWIWIRIRNAGSDPGGVKSANTERKNRAN